MHGLPLDFDPAVFVGRAVEQMCFAEYTAHVMFDERTSITLESSYSYATSEHTEFRVYDAPQSSTEVLRLVGRSVVRATVDGGRDLRLAFDDGQILVCSDDLPNFESYSIQIGDLRIVV